MSKAIDLNADVGEGFDDAALMPQLTSVNVAAGGHAGDDASIAHTVALARTHGVAIGAHPSYPDREGFGRAAMELSAEALEATLVEQISRVQRAAGNLRHVKPHGALYHRANASRDVALVIAMAVKRVDPALVLVAQAGSLLLEVARDAGLKTVGEAFADRRYGADGTLVPRSAGVAALITDPSLAAEQAVQLAARDGVQMICVHSDTEGAAAIAAEVRKRLVVAGYAV